MSKSTDDPKIILLLKMLEDLASSNLDEFTPGLHGNDPIDSALANLKQLTDGLHQRQNQGPNILEEIFAGVAHELNQPLNGIKLISQGVLRDISKNRLNPTGLSKELGDIVKQTDRMAETINHMRMLSKIIYTAPAPINVNDSLDSALRLFGTQLSNRNISVTKELQQDLPLVISDPLAMERAFIGCIINARNEVEKSRTDGRKMLIKTTASSERKQVEVMFIHNGNCNTENKDKYLSKFIKEIVGTIEITTKQDEGTTLKVILPSGQRK